MKIALDLDGTLADIISAWLKRKGSRLDYNYIHRWDFWKDLGYTQSRFIDELSKCWMEWESIRPLEDNIDLYVKALNEFGKVDIVTARDSKSITYAKRWLRYHGIKYDKLVLVKYGEDKAKLDYDLFIDDSPLNVHAIAMVNKRALLYDQPWNRYVKFGTIARMSRIKSLREVLYILNKEIKQ